MARKTLSSKTTKKFKSQRTKMSKSIKNTTKKIKRGSI